MNAGQSLGSSVLRTIQATQDLKQRARYQRELKLPGMNTLGRGAVIHQERIIKIEPAQVLPVALGALSNYNIVTISGSSTSITVPYKGMTAAGLVDTFVAQGSTGGQPVSYAEPAADAFTIYVPDAPEIVSGDGLVYKIGYHVLAVAL